MGFMDTVRNTANSAAEALSDAAKDISGKGKEMAETSRIRKAIKNEETKINNLYMVMGEKLYKDNATAPLGYEIQFNGIRAAKAEIERLQKEAQVTTATAAPACPNCGAKITAGQLFCQGCGTKLK